MPNLGLIRPPPDYKYFTPEPRKLPGEQPPGKRYAALVGCAIALGPICVNLRPSAVVVLTFATLREFIFHFLTVSEAGGETRVRGVLRARFRRVG